MKVRELKQKLKEVISGKRTKINIYGFIVDKNIAMKLLYGNVILILKNEYLKKLTITYKNMLENLDYLKEYQQTNCNVVKV